MKQNQQTFGSNVDSEASSSMTKQPQGQDLPLSVNAHTSSCMTEQKQGEEKLFSVAQMARFSSGITAYRIVRLSVELFLVVRVQELGFSISRAGTVYLLYSLASILAGLFFIWFPSICFGSYQKALTYFIVSAVSMFGGFVGTFYLRSYGGMIALAILTGMGTATWNINYQTITNLSFPKAQLGSVARMRQLFESIGFLVPSVCLAIVTTAGNVNINVAQASEEEEGSKSFVTASATILAAVGFAFSLLSADQIIGNATRIQPKDDNETSQMGVWQALKSFFGTSVVKYFLLNSLLLAFSNILMGTLSLVTELYFGLEPAWLWLAAIAFPIGGMISIGAAMLSPLKRNSKIVVLSGMYKLITFLILCLVLGFTVFPNSVQQLAKALVFFFGLIIGMLYSTAFAASIQLWLQRLKECSTSFVSRASVINNLAVQAVIASIFQLQTVLVDAVLDADESGKGASAVFFGPLIVLCLICLLLARSIPYPKDIIFGWPMPCTFSPILKGAVALLELCGLSTAANSLFFSSFYDFRTGRFSAHLENATVQRGPEVAKGATLTPSDLQEHLEQFDNCETAEMWWESDATLCNLLVDNQEALEKRLELIEKATSKIWMVTWLIEHSPTGERLANALIRRAQEGVEVRVMVDAVTLYYLHQKHKIRGMNDMETLEKLARSGVEVRMLDSIHEELEPSFVIGNHRKILLVDDTWMITGGRNNSDRYFTTTGFHYHDADVLLRGSFEESTSALYKSLWDQAREVDSLFGLTAEASTTKELKAAHTQTSSELPEDTNTISDMSISDDATDSSKLESAEEGQADSYFDSVAQDPAPKDDCQFRANPTPEEGLEQHQEVSLFQLEHKAGNKDGYDITFSTLLFLIETSEERIDLVMGYFQLFPELEAALVRAKVRGVHIRIATNSDLTNGLPGFNAIFRQALERLLEMGVEVYVTANLSEYKQAGDFCLHYKLAVIDQRAALVGSWNCMGTSVFYDSDFSVVMMDQRDDFMKRNNPFQPFEDIIDGGINAGRFVPLREIQEHSFKVPLYYYPLSSKYGIQQMKRGF